MLQTEVDAWQDTGPYGPQRRTGLVFDEVVREFVGRQITNVIADQIKASVLFRVRSQYRDLVMDQDFEVSVVPEARAGDQVRLRFLKPHVITIYL